MSGDEACNWITPVEGYHSFYRCSIKVPFLYLIIAISFAYMITAFVIFPFLFKLTIFISYR